MDELPKTTVDALADDAVLLDVRDPAAWLEGHAPGSVNIPLAELADRLDEVPQVDGPLPVSCGGGSKAGRATAMLREAGIDAVELRGGMRGWRSAGRPMVTGGR